MTITSVNKREFSENGENKVSLEHFLFKSLDFRFFEDEIQMSAYITYARTL